MGGAPAVFDVLPRRAERTLDMGGAPAVFEVLPRRADEDACRLGAVEQLRRQISHRAAPSL